MRALLLTTLLVLTGCEAPAVEPKQTRPHCTHTFSSETPLRGELELGSLENGAFRPFAPGAEVEIAPWPDPEGVGEWYFKGVHARVTLPRDVGAQLCVDLENSLESQSVEVVDGVPLQRGADGAYVGGPIPLAAGLSLQDNAAFAQRLGEPVTFEGEVLTGSSAQEPHVRGFLPRLQLTRVNREGFLGVPLPVVVAPDAGPTQPGVLEVGLSFITVRPGEDVRALVSLSGDRRGEAVTFTVAPLPAGVTLTFPAAALGPTQSESWARLSVGSSVGPMSIPFTVTATGATTRGSSTDGVINVVPAADREVAVTIFPARASPPLGSTFTAEVHLAPLGGFQGPVTLVATAPPELEVTLPASPVQLDAPLDVPIQVRAKGPMPNGLVHVHAVAGREVWSRPEAALEVLPAEPLQSQLVLLPGFSERRVIAPGGTLDWTMRAWEQPAAGGVSRPLTLSVAGTPSGCTALVPDGGVNRVVRLSCDAGLEANAATLTVTAGAGADLVSGAFRLVVAGAPAGLENFGVAPEPRPQGLDSEWPQVAGTRNDVFTLVIASADQGSAVVDFAPSDGGYAAPVPTAGQVIAVATVGQAASTRAVTVARSSGRLFAGSTQGGPGNARGAFDVAGHLDGTVWAATGAGSPTLRPWVGRFSAGAWAEQGPPLPDAPGLTDLALAVRSLTAVLVTAEPALVVRRLEGGAWTALPPLPAQLVPVPLDRRGGPRRVLDVAIDNLAQPVVALVTPGNTLEVYRLEAAAWVRLSGVDVSPGVIPLSLSMTVNPFAADPNGRLTLVWHEASQALAVPSGQRVLPRHAAQSRLRLVRHTTTGWVELPTPGVDLDGGMPEQPFVAFDGDGRPYVSFVEDGRVFVQRAAP